MKIVSISHSCMTKADGSMTDLTAEVEKALESTKIQRGIVTIFCPGSTYSVSTIEFEEGLLKDFSSAMSKIAPENIRYLHHEKWHDDNGRSHIKATLMGPSLTIPIVDKKLTLGTWQQIVLIEWDTQDRKREIIFQFLGE